jgi:MFS transporter, ACS family, tartrate transporter
MQPSNVEKSTLRTVAWRLIPFICLLYLLNIIDRVNLGFARLQMQEDLGLSKGAFDLGFGIFYLGYILFEVPSNLLMRRVGARIWIARIMITWGLVSASMLFARNIWEFYALRVLLGVAEAGFFPGIILYLSYWFPDRERAKMSAFFMLAISLSNLVGNPVSGWTLDHLDHVGGMRGWQWLLLIEGIPSVIMGIVAFFYLTDYPSDASWLSEEQREWLLGRMRREEQQRQRSHGPDRWAAMVQPRIWLLIAIYFTVAVTTNAAGAYFPTFIREQFVKASNFQVGLVLALPHICALLGMSLVGIHSDRTGERRWHLAGAALVAALGWALMTRTKSPELVVLGICLAQTGMMSMMPVFWTLPSAILSGAAAAGGIALINSIANVGGFFGASILGLFGQSSMALILMGGAALALLARFNSTDSRIGC